MCRRGPSASFSCSLEIESKILENSLCARRHTHLRLHTKNHISKFSGRRPESKTFDVHRNSGSTSCLDRERRNLGPGHDRRTARPCSTTDEDLPLSQPRNHSGTSNQTYDGLRIIHTPNRQPRTSGCDSAHNAGAAAHAAVPSASCFRNSRRLLTALCNAVRGHAVNFYFPDRTNLR